MNSTELLKQKMARRKAELERKKDQNLWNAIMRKAKKDGGGKHSSSAWMADKFFGYGDYDYMGDGTKSNEI